MANRPFPFSLTALAAAIAGALLGNAAPAQTSITCGGSSSGLSCSASGTQTGTVTIRSDDLQPVPPMQATSSADITVTVDASTKAALEVLSIGANGNSGGTLTGTDTQGMTVTNTGSLTLQATQGSPIVTSGTFYGLFSQMLGGNAASSSDGEYGGNGGVAGQSLSEILSVTNHGDISMNLSGVTVAGGAALAAFSQGGAGGGTTKDHNPGGAGGQSAGASIVNTGKIDVTLAGKGRYAGILAYSGGGNGADQYDGGANTGGGSGNVSVTNSGSVALNWTWAGGSSGSSSALYGILAQSQSGDGGDSLDDGLGNGGSAGIGDARDLSARVTLQAGGDVTVTQTGTPPAAGAGVAAIVVGGKGGDGLADEDKVIGGNGGNAGTIGASQAALQITDTDASVSTTGDQLSALRLQAVGGAGGENFPQTSYYDRNGGNGGQAGDAKLAVASVNEAVALSTDGTNAHGIQTLQQGGAGGAGGQYGGDGIGLGAHNAGIGGSGGNTGGLTIQLTGSKTLPVSVTTVGDDSHGIYSVLQGGRGADGGPVSGTIAGGAGGAGGDGGTTGKLTVTLEGTSIGTQGSNAFGILAQSLGNDGGDGGSSTLTIAIGGDGGAGGSTGALTVTTDAGTSISTQGQNAIGIVAQTASGSGGAGGDANGQFSGTDGAGGAGGTAGNITVTNAGSISTVGAGGVGILAQSLAGVGGAGSDNSGIFYSKGGSGGMAGSAGEITVNNSGQISTAGGLAFGILAQSIGGTGGVAGSASGLGVSLGGDDDSNPFRSDANQITINGSSSGKVTTGGTSAIGVLAQSIGGGGGVGGGSEGIVSIGGSGGKGGAGGTVSGFLKDFQIGTSGDNAHAFVAQSIGGGGGNAGNADSLGLFASVSIGQSGGSGGAGSGVTANLDNSTIIVEGTKAAGIVAQSIGGGGGSGGRAFSGTVGVGYAASVAVGGSGGSGGSGGAVSSQMIGGRVATAQISQLIDGTCPAGAPCLPANELPVDAFGAVIQSIGGGGGVGGNAIAQGAAIGIPYDPQGNQVSVATSVSLGGSGGIAGDGGYVTFATSQGAQISTNGQGSHGVLIQSIGGGGGAGGDSSSLAASLSYGGPMPTEGEGTSLAIDGSFALGAGGGAGGNGGSVWTAVGGLINVADGKATFTADPTGSAGSNITTFGDYANGISAQSIGGGGGNAGFGSANTQSFGSGTTVAANVGLGGTGGTGGNGGLVQVNIMPTGVVQTWGSGAIGVLAQSIGGGGGTSQGGAFTIAGSKSSKAGGLTLKVGKTGGDGGYGGEVDVTVDGQIITAGGDAPGVQAQSIGGGGGQGGSAGSDAAFDNPVLAALHVRADGSDVVKNAYALISSGQLSGTLHYQGELTIGGEGGFGEIGGNVNVALGSSASIQTQGDWSTGIFAQSVGGGGGKGGNSFATGSGWVNPSTFNLNTSISLGGDGGIAADGGNVTTTLGGGTISTHGFGAAGVFAQSIGGGGGHGADGSDGFVGTLSLGAAGGGDGGNGGSGGSVTLATLANSSSTITTTGEAAFGVLLQSVGGGGGFAGAGSSVRLDVADDPIPAMHMSTGGTINNSQGNGGNVQWNDNGSVSVSTQGANAIGILAQSVGGAGGVAINSQSQLGVSTISAGIQGAQLESELNVGGDVTVGVALNSQISTSGAWAHGIVAQSVGGGGGLVGLPASTAVLSTDRTEAAAAAIQAGYGSGGDVAVNVDGTIATNGTGAIGILAQSVSGTGGMIMSEDGKTVYAGSAPVLLESGEGSVNVTVNESAIVSATGVNGVGIFAQTGNSIYGPSVTVNGLVTGGKSGTGAGIWIDGDSPGALTIGESGRVAGYGGVAILATNAQLGVDNSGTVQGSVKLSGGSMNSSGDYAAGAEFEGSLFNRGRIALGGAEGLLPGSARTQFATTTLTGALTQTAAGTLQVGVDFGTLESDALVVNGTAQLDGGLRIAPRALMPGREVKVLTVNGTQSGTLTAVDTPLFDYETRQDGNATHVRVAGADFNATAMGLKPNQVSVANHLQRSWDQGGSAALAPLYAALDAAAGQGAGEYRERVSDLSPGVALAPAAQMQFGMARFTTAMMSCPAFAETGSLTKEQGCFWGEVTARRTNQDGGDGASSFAYDSETYQFGGQRQIAPGWFLGGSVAYQNSRLRGDDHRVSGSGDSGYAGVVLKREAGAWTFSGALGSGYGSYDLVRNLDIDGFDKQAKSSPDVYSFGARLRAARTFDRGSFYLKPYVDLTATYSRMPAYRESGDALRLNVDSSDQFVFGLAPTLEIGGRVDLPKGAMMRPFAYAGVSLLSEDGWKTKSRLDGVPGSAGRFTTSMPTDNVITRVGAGIQVMRAGRVDFRLQYDGEFASGGNSHSGALKLAVPF